MTVTTTLLIATAALLFTHSVYSAHEHSTTLTTTTTSTAIPTDIALETLLAAVLLCFGIVVRYAGELRPIQLRVWAGKLERERGAGTWAQLDGAGVGGGFWDVRSSRKESAVEK
ncbi:magnesium transporter [Tricharina praecox]|uniref:magnesium transporter n=1 Tax=Tricharina praecox TaxID=43433 RepID=UPI00221FFF99|nr:magnesium transporter [Tricharina praecox]KAI5851995.1 magnesium transporter [Tricharina praecox]